MEIAIKFLQSRQLNILNNEKLEKNFTNVQCNSKKKRAEKNLILSLWNIDDDDKVENKRLKKKSVRLVCHDTKKNYDDANRTHKKKKTHEQ